MNKKFKKKHIQVIPPLRIRCKCGARVTDHHWLCNICYSKKSKNKIGKERKILIENYMKNKYGE